MIQDYDRIRLLVRFSRCINTYADLMSTICGDDDILLSNDVEYGWGPREEMLQRPRMLRSELADSIDPICPVWNGDRASFAVFLEVWCDSLGAESSAWERE